MPKALVYRRLYRSLLKVSKPFCSPSPNAAVLSSLLHRTGIDDGLDWERLSQIKEIETEEENTKRPRPLEEARDLSKSYAPHNSDDGTTAALKLSLAERKEPHRVLFRRLLREVVAGSPSGLRHMQFPNQVNVEVLREVIAREFRIPDAESMFDVETRQQVAFLALRELNKKLTRAELLEHQNDTDTGLDEEGVRLRNQMQAAMHVSPLPLNPEEYLKPGTFLIAHPLLNGYFRRTVVCILDHSERSSTSEGGTYGLIVNRVGVSPKTGKNQTLQDVLRTMPPQLAESFGETTVRDGGPVHMSLQMIHSTSDVQDVELVGEEVGGSVLSMLTDDDNSAAVHSDRAIYYQGDILQAAEAVKKGQLDQGAFQFQFQLNWYIVFLQ